MQLLKYFKLYQKCTLEQNKQKQGWNIFTNKQEAG